MSCSALDSWCRVCCSRCQQHSSPCFYWSCCGGMGDESGSLASLLLRASDGRHAGDVIDNAMRALAVNDVKARVCTMLACAALALVCAGGLTFEAGVIQRSSLGRRGSGGSGAHQARHPVRCHAEEVEVALTCYGACAAVPVQWRRSRGVATVVKRRVVVQAQWCGAWPLCGQDFVVMQRCAGQRQ